MKIYSCTICNSILDYKPVRLVKQLYGKGNYKQYGTVEHYDFCLDCYKKFDNWLKKRTKEGDEYAID